MAEEERGVRMKVLYILVFATLLGCGNNNPPFAQQLNSEYYSASGYDLSSPNQKHQLPFILSEISGLTYFENSKIATVQDEIGKIFIYDLERREIIQTISFANRGDYESIALVNEEFYVAQSNGYLYKISLDETQAPIKIKTKLNSKNNIEGLAYDKTTNSLLLACKGVADFEKKEYKGKAVFEFNLAKDKLAEKPRFLITKKNIKEAAGIEVKHFRPSGIAQNPISNNFYLLSHTGKLLIILTEEGNVKSAFKLNPKIFNQPEGICFSPDGTLYISNESRGISATLLEFKYLGIN